MPKFIKRPIIIEAEQWFPDKYVEGVETGRDVRLVHGFTDNSNGWIETLEGGHIVSPGDWIITGIAGEKYPCKPDIFVATYDLVEDK